MEIDGNIKSQIQILPILPNKSKIPNPKRRRKYLEKKFIEIDRNIQPSAVKFIEIG